MRVELSSKPLFYAEVLSETGEVCFVCGNRKILLSKEQAVEFCQGLLTEISKSYRSPSSPTEEDSGEEEG